MNPYDCIEVFTADPKLVEKYKQTWVESFFFVDGFTEPIQIGKVLSDLENLLKEQNQSHWFYITAFNPSPKMLEEEENLKRNRQLEQDLQSTNLFYRKGRGIDKEGIHNNSRGEDSFLVLGDLKTADFLMNQHEQLAVVRGDLGKPAILRFR